MLGRRSSAWLGEQRGSEPLRPLDQQIERLDANKSMIQKRNLKDAASKSRNAYAIVDREDRLVAGLYTGPDDPRLEEAWKCFPGGRTAAEARGLRQVKVDCIIIEEETLETPNHAVIDSNSCSRRALNWDSVMAVDDAVVRDCVDRLAEHMVPHIKAIPGSLFRLEITEDRCRFGVVILNLSK